MTVEEFKQYYSNLLIQQYRNKAKAKGHIETIVEPVAMSMLPNQIVNIFDLETATGFILDTIGKYIGVSRIVSGPNSFRVSLNDADYLTLLKMGIIRNTAHGSLGEIQELVGLFFANKVLIADNGLMQMNYFVGENIGSTALQYALVYGDHLPRPMAVQVAVVIVPPLGLPYFGFRTYVLPGSNISGFNSYALYNTNAPWLSYTT